MCLTALEASQANNKLEIPADPLWVQGESLEACPKSTLDPRSFSDIRTYQVPLRVQARPKVLLRHPHLPSPSSSPSSTRGPSPTSATARSFSDYINPGSFTQIFNSSRTIPLVGGPDQQRFPRRLPPPRWIQLSDRILWLTKSITRLDYPHVLNVLAPLFQ